MLSLEEMKADFPWLQDSVYLNTAAEGIPPKPVVDALHQYAEDKKLGMDGRSLHEKQWEGTRNQAAIAYGMEPDEIGLCSCSAEAYNLLSLAMRFKEGDEVVISDLDFPSGATPWMHPECPAQVKLWKSQEGALQVEDLLPLLSANTRLVQVSLVSFYNGFTISLREVTEAIRSRTNAVISVDVTQALGRIPVDLHDVDFVISSTHKWILGSHGGGLVGVPRRRSEELTVPAGGWFNLENAFGPDRFHTINPKSGAASYSVGMPNYAAIYANHAALAYINRLGVVSIDRYATPLVHTCLEGLQRLGLDILTPPEHQSLAGILAFKHPRADAIHQYLHARSQHIMSHAGRLRIAVHFYNTADDIEQFLSALSDALRAV